MVVFDTSVLAIAFDENANVPLDPGTGKPLERCRDRVDFLLSNLSKGKRKVLIPTPALAEYLVQGGNDKDKRLQVFTESRAFDVSPFCTKAAIECALIEDGDSKIDKALSPTETKAKVKFDRQVIAIAKANSAKTIYTGDINLAKRAKANNVDVVMTWELPLPPPSQQDSQMGLGLE